MAINKFHTGLFPSILYTFLLFFGSGSSVVADTGELLACHNRLYDAAKPMFEFDAGRISILKDDNIVVFPRVTERTAEKEEKVVILTGRSIYVHSRKKFGWDAKRLKIGDQELFLTLYSTGGGDLKTPAEFREYHLNKSSIRSSEQREKKYQAALRWAGHGTANDSLNADSRALVIGELESMAGALTEQATHPGIGLDGKLVKLWKIDKSQAQQAIEMCLETIRNLLASSTLEAKDRSSYSRFERVLKRSYNRFERMHEKNRRKYPTAAIPPAGPSREKKSRSGTKGK